MIEEEKSLKTITGIITLPIKIFMFLAKFLIISPIFICSAVLDWYNNKKSLSDTVSHYLEKLWS